MAEMDLARSPWSTARSTARSSAAGDEPKQAYSPVTGLALTGRPAPRRAKSTPRRRGKGTRQGVPGFTGRKVFNAIQLTPKVGEIFSVAESDWLSGGGVAADADAEVAEPRDLQAQLLRQLSPRRPSRTSGHPLSLDLRTQIAAEGVAIAQAAAAGGAANDVAAAKARRHRRPGGVAQRSHATALVEWVDGAAGVQGSSAERMCSSQRHHVQPPTTTMGTAIAGWKSDSGGKIVAPHRPLSATAFAGAAGKGSEALRASTFVQSLERDPVARAGGTEASFVMSS